jgi:ferrous iron transport protein B
MASQAVKIALAGNPNVGKSTIFNALTGSHQHVGNWPGKTVEKKEGRLLLEGTDVIVVDLPGTYSLSAYSIEEIVSREFIINEHPDAVVAVVDAANLERNLYLVTQLLELNVPVIVALNMSDIARGRGLTIDAAKLSAGLNGTPVIETVGSSGIGLDALKRAIQQAAAACGQRQTAFTYEAALERELTLLQHAIAAIPALAERYQPRWLAIKLLENDEDICSRVVTDESLLAAARAAAERIESETGDDAETWITDGRYAFISSVVSAAVSRPREVQETTSDKIDRVLTHRVYGLPIFLLLMWVVFQITANVSAPLVDWLDGVISGPLTRWAAALFGALGLGGSWPEALLTEAVIAGVGGVLAFVPVLIALYLAIGVLEDSGYMARAAFVMDRVMRVVGLHGKSFLPMLVGFGCTVPAVYATRTLENDDDRRLTAFLVTFMSCGARLPVYVVIGTAFFGARSGSLIFGLYVLGIAVALLTGWALKRSVYRNKPPQPFVMELPPYRAPRLHDVWRQTWNRTAGFVRKAGTLILATSIAVWLLMAVPSSGDAAFNTVTPEASLFGTASKLLAPLFAPAGFGNWQSSGALITGFIAKEVVVGTMSQIYAVDAPAEDQPQAAPGLLDDLAGIASSLGEAIVLTGQEIVNIVPRTVNLVPGVQMAEADFLGLADQAEDTTALEAALTQNFAPLAAVAFTVFVLLYTPCMVTISAMRHEFGRRFVLYQIAYTLALAWTGAVIVYQGGLLLGLGG